MGNSKDSKVWEGETTHADAIANDRADWLTAYGGLAAEIIHELKPASSDRDIVAAIRSEWPQQASEFVTIRKGSLGTSGGVRVNDSSRMPQGDVSIAGSHEIFGGLCVEGLIEAVGVLLDKWKDVESLVDVLVRCGECRSPT